MDSMIDAVDDVVTCSSCEGVELSFKGKSFSIHSFLRILIKLSMEKYVIIKKLRVAIF